MPSPQNSSLINEYSSVFTSLQAGKKQLIQWGAQSVVLNRYIVDAAGSTAACDPGVVIQTIDLTKVSWLLYRRKHWYCRNRQKKVASVPAY